MPASLGRCRCGSRAAPRAVEHRCPPVRSGGPEALRNVLTLIDGTGRDVLHCAKNQLFPWGPARCELQARPRVSRRHGCDGRRWLDCPAARPGVRERRRDHDGELRRTAVRRPIVGARARWCVRRARATGRGAERRCHRRGSGTPRPLRPGLRRPDFAAAACGRAASRARPSLHGRCTNVRCWSRERNRQSPAGAPDPLQPSLLDGVLGAGWEVR